MSLLDVESLTVRMLTGNGDVTIVDDVSFSIEAGQIVGVAGESGSGKTISALALLQLLPRGVTAAGRAWFDGCDLLSLSGRGIRRVRGKEIAIVFQDPATSLHPMMPIGRQLTEHVLVHEGISRRAARARAVELLAEVRIPDPDRALSTFPHQLSGGMRQRVAIASALAARPRLLIADEPTTALDVTVQAGILHLLERLRAETGLAIMLITHDLGVLAALADVISVMYGGRIVESGPTHQLLSEPRHPYTRALLDALPHPDGDVEAELRPIPGTPPTPRSRPFGCAFHPRCKYVRDECRKHVPPLVSIDRTRRLACPVDPFRAA